MSTEYRLGIPSTAHVEAATRLGLEWNEARLRSPRRWRFQGRDGELWCDFCSDTQGWDRDLQPLSSGRIIDRTDIAHCTFRPVRLDGTPVDWEVLDQEVARMGQQGQPQGFRADLLARISRHFSLIFRSHNQVSNLTEISSIDDVGIHSPHWQWGWGTADREAPTRQNRADILARWAVYQELKPLYDIVDGAQGEAAMPRDVIAHWWRPAQQADRARQPIDHCTLVRNSASPRYPQGRGPTCSWYADGTDTLGIGLRNFAAVLDAVAERRVAERIQGQTPTVTSAQPEPRRFADVRPDRHGWRWWRLFGSDCGALGTPIEANPVHGWRVKDDPDADWHWLVHYNSAVDGIRTVIPTDEQGNPVSWDSIGRAVSSARDVSATENEVQRITQVVASVTQQALQQTLGSPVTVSPTTGHVEPPTVAPSRFALIEIDDADPTAERIRQEQAAERQRIAALRQRLVAERAAQPQEMAKESVSRFDLIEPDPQADPAASIRAWEARQAATKVRPTAAPPRIAKPAAAPRRPAIEVVDAEVDGLNRSEAFAALFGRALNGGC